MDPTLDSDSTDINEISMREDTYSEDSEEADFEENPFHDCPCDPWGETMSGYYYHCSKLLELCNNDIAQVAYHIEQCDNIGYPWVLSVGDHHPGWNRKLCEGEERQYFLPDLTPTRNRCT